MEFDPRPFPPLAPREIHVWCVDLDLPPSAETPADCLCDEERRRAVRFVREADRRRFTASHIALRVILGRCLGIPPGRVEVSARAGGKPELSARSDGPLLHYNLSHSGGMALVAVSSDQEVGVDVEQVRPLDDVDSIVNRYFAPGERAHWQASPEDERLAAFFRCWTRKEAYLKARGIGLSAALDQFEVVPSPDRAVCLVQHVAPEPSEGQWHVYDLQPAANYMAACAVQHPAEEIRVHPWLQGSA